MTNQRVTYGRTTMFWIVRVAFMVVLSGRVFAQEPTPPTPDNADPRAGSQETTSAPAASGRERPLLPAATPGSGDPGQADAVEADVRRLSVNFELLRGEAERDNAEAQ